MSDQIPVLQVRKLRDRFRSIPGNVVVELEPVANVDHLLKSNSNLAQSGDSMLTKGVTVSKLRELLGGDEGELLDDTGQRHHISLTPWAEADTERTRLAIRVSFRPDKPIKVTKRVMRELGLSEDLFPNAPEDEPDDN